MGMSVLQLFRQQVKQYYVLSLINQVLLPIYSYTTAITPAPPTPQIYLSDCDIIIMHTGPSSTPVNLQYTLDTTATDSATVRLDWDPPLDDGGVAITHYQISVNMSEPVITTDTVATFTLNSTGEHLVQVRAVNCAGVSDDASIIVSFNGK